MTEAKDSELANENGDNATYKPGPLTRDDYEDTFQRADKFTDLELRNEQQAMMENVVDDRRAELHHLCVDAAIKAWDPSRPPFIDAHFSMWTITHDVYDGSLNPPKADSNPWNCCHPQGDYQARCTGQRAINTLRRDYTSDNYEEELEAMRLQAEAELQDGIGELSPIRYGIHVPVTPSYSENALISTLAEEYYFIAGYISWADLVDPLLVDRLGYLSKDPLLVGLRYDMTQMANELILDSTTDRNFAAIEYYGFPYELLIRPDQLRYACHIAYRHPKMKFVLNHCAIPTDYCSVMNPNSQMFANWLNDLQYLSKYPNVFCKLTGTTGWCNKTNFYTQKPMPVEGLVAAYNSGSEEDDNKSEKSEEEELIYDVKNDYRAINVMTQAINFFGPDRCIYGSGWPVSRAIIPDQTGWKECGIRRQLTSKIVDRGKSAKARKIQHECLDMWETCRLVEHCLEEAGLGSVDDKYKVFAKNAASVYKLTIRPYGANNLDA